MSDRLKATIIFLVFAWTSCRSDCTSICFVSGDTVLFGNNLDWYTGVGMLVINKRNVSKTGCWFENKPSWTSKYGSITINQFGREFPSRGMNEAGLAVGEMTLSETRFPDADSRPAIAQPQWIQYQLDNCATVDEVIASDAKIRIDFGEYHSHFLVADSTGACVSMEWLNGKLVYHTRETMPIKVLTNSTYASCLVYVNQNPSPAASDFSSYARFCRASEMIKHYDSLKDGSAVDYGFAILTSVGPSNFNKWNLVFDLKNHRFHVRTNTNRNIRYVDFSSFDFTCNTPVKLFELDNQFSGDVHNSFIDYDYTINRKAIFNIFQEVGAYVGNASDWAKETMARYPETTTCRIENSNSGIKKYELHQNFPNPFNQSTEIRYALEESNDIEISICNITGKEIEILFDGYETAGEHDVHWSSKGSPSGIYFTRLQAGLWMSRSWLC
jgi:penicillin V acylase-like amidase (Ntn superfamily)